MASQRTRSTEPDAFSASEPQTAVQACADGDKPGPRRTRSGPRRATRRSPDAICATLFGAGAIRLIEAAPRGWELHHCRNAVEVLDRAPLSEVVIFCPSAAQTRAAFDTLSALRNSGHAVPVIFVVDLGARRDMASPHVTEALDRGAQLILPQFFRPEYVFEAAANVVSDEARETLRASMRAPRTLTCGLRLDPPASLLVIAWSESSDFLQLGGNKLFEHDVRFRVDAVAAAVAAERIQARRYEGYVLLLASCLEASLQLCAQIKSDDEDAVILTLDSNPTAERNAVARQSGAFLALPPVRSDSTVAHALAAEIAFARERPTQFGRGPVRVRVDVGRLIVDGKPIRLGPTEVSVIERLCRAHGRPVHDEVLHEASGKGTADVGNSRSVYRMLTRFSTKLMPYGDRLIREGRTWRLELDRPDDGL